MKEKKSVEFYPQNLRLFKLTHWVIFKTMHSNLLVIVALLGTIRHC